FSAETLRQIVHVSVGGDQTRVWFSNRFGQAPLRIGSAHVALSAQGNSIVDGSDRELTFDHLTSIVIPPGATIVSDPVTLHVPAFANLAISTYFPGMALASTEHTLALATSYATGGNHVDAAQWDTAAATEKAWYFLSGVDVYAPHDSAVVAFGDSITDGWRSTADQNRRWPDDLATRLASAPNTAKAGVLGVVNSGISGNRVLLDGAGPNALARFDDDVLARSNARYLIVMESVNDIGRYARDRQPYGNLAERLESGLAQMAVQAHQHGIAVFAATLTPYKGCTYYSPEGEAVRHQLNQWIRTSHVFDGVVDFAKATRDPQHPLRFLPEYDSGDHLHPNDAGFKAMAAAIDLNLFTRTPSR
ncbi:MAG TPA: SGNH/GDSL hydrolase family protein, partial [Acidobacteriaceae bacterium]|nr:SGNH/GDSL hydrolase family protein [Acidobacteriaceae bacterium]